jgi:predicted adenylyl cyclase CyaB
MARNVEIKARLIDPAATLTRVEAIAPGPTQTIQQEDTFFAVVRGRLKLRVFATGAGELIYYERDDIEGPKESRYHIAPVAQPEPLKTVLAAALGLRGVVRKTRRLYLVGQTRIHVDDVGGLGSFLELEVVLRDDQSAAQGERIAADLMARLGIATADLIARAYIDLLAPGPVL